MQLRHRFRDDEVIELTGSIAEDATSRPPSETTRIKMNISAWKLLLTSSCMSLSALAVGAPLGNTTTADVQHAHPAHLALIAPARLVQHHQTKNNVAGASAFRYMDAVPVHNSNSIHPAVMSFPQTAAKKNQCEAMTGNARQHCFELMMPT